MSNIMNIARKDFSDLIGNPCVFIVLAVYLVAVLLNVLDIHGLVSAGLLDNEHMSIAILQYLISILTVFGGILAVTVGFTTISSEKYGGALNTLIVKPVYRDMIINGKFIACICFLLCVLGLTTALYVSSLLIFCGDAVGEVIFNVMDRLAVIFLLSILYSIFFLSLSMFVSIIVNKRSTAFLTCVILLIVIGTTLPSVSIAGNLQKVFGTIGNQIIIMVAGLSPSWMLKKIALYGIYNPSWSLMKCLADSSFELLKMIVFPIVTLVMCYIAFLRRDIA